MNVTCGIADCVYVFTYSSHYLSTVGSLTLGTRRSLEDNGGVPENRIVAALPCQGLATKRPLVEVIFTQSLGCGRNVGSRQADYAQEL